MMLVRLPSLVLLAVLCCSIASCGAEGAGEGKAISGGGSDVEGKSKMDCSITILYDNTVAESGVWRPETAEEADGSEVPKCKAAWGFAALIELGGKVVLFDTGGDPKVLKHNVEALTADLSLADAFVISHEHWDHAGGLSYPLSLKPDPAVYVPSGVASKLASSCPEPAEVVESADPTEICPGISTTGTLSGPPNEHGLVLETAEGKVLVTGCAHPGVVELSKAAKGSGDKLYLVLGGFHMGGMSSDRVDEIVAEMQKLTRKAAPCHCTGEAAIEQFAEAFGDNFVRVGAGLRLDFPASQ